MKKISTPARREAYKVREEFEEGWTQKDRRFDCQQRWVVLKQGWWLYTYSITEIYYIIVVAVVLVCLYLRQDDGWKLTQNWHLANCEQGANHRQLKRHLASITVELVFGLTTAEQVDAGQFTASTCSCPKWNTDESVENSFDCICNSYVCV